LSDARATLTSAPWLEPAPPDVAVRTFDVAFQTMARATGEVVPKPPPRESTQLKVAVHG
jgi:hypothetical protein